MCYRNWNHLFGTSSRMCIRSRTRRDYVQLRLFRFRFRWNLCLHFNWGSLNYFSSVRASCSKVNYLGNMSNPCINRWGLNSFWHHYWYSDSRYYLNLQQDNIILDLLNTYLKYGINMQNNHFVNPFWYKTSPSTYHIPSTLTYYRWLTVYNETLRMTSTYRLRLESEETFQTRINVLKFNSWYVLNLYWFQPDKDKKKLSKTARKKITTTNIKLETTSFSSITKLTSTFKRLPSTLNYSF